MTKEIDSLLESIQLHGRNCVSFGEDKLGQKELSTQYADVFSKLINIDHELEILKIKLEKSELEMELMNQSFFKTVLN